jgi:hypothetical protein
MKWIVGAIAVVSVVAVVHRRKPQRRSTWTRTTDVATSAASAAANGVKGFVTHR